MLYKIIGDSCMDLTEELKLDPHFQMIPLTASCLAMARARRLSGRTRRVW